MAWLAVTLMASQAELEQCESVFTELQAAAITTLPLNEETPAVLEPAPGATPTWQQNRVQALFPLSADVATLRATLAAQLSPAQHRSLVVDFVEDQDWIQAWRQHAVQACFGSKLWLLPTDAPLPAEYVEARQQVLRLDPGLAFGSGGHPTTALCLQWLAETPLQGLRVLDYGCGSGVLGIAALLLGASQVDAVDIDPQALLATRSNARANHIADASIRTLLPDELTGTESYDLVVANILANPLISLAPKLSSHLAASSAARPGQLVLAGLLEAQQQSVMAAYPTFRFDSQTSSGWSRLVGTFLGAEALGTEALGSEDLATEAIETEVGNKNG